MNVTSIETVSSQVTEANKSIPKNVPNVADAQNFADLMSSGGSNSLQSDYESNGVSRTNFQYNDFHSTTQIQTVDENGLGQRIISGIENISENHSRAMDEMNTFIENPQMDIKNLFKLQLEMHKLTTEQLMLAKTAGKSTQNLDTLLKAQ